MSPFAAPLLATWRTATPTNDLEAIRARVADDMEGVKSGDAARLHPDALTTRRPCCSEQPRSARAALRLVTQACTPSTRRGFAVFESGGAV
ncbi:hypothetical protein GCM10012319_54240 [Comamonas sp. KCTC 72670]|nr:hypothetical protein GCM10012319_54240 [Comamonas sp. KCTC 72670]